MQVDAGHVPVPPTPTEQTKQQLHWSMLTRGEKESFRGGLRARIMGRIDEALRAANADEYVELRSKHIESYLHLTAVLSDEDNFSESVTAEDVFEALELIDRELGEESRHRLEHALNMSEGARRMLANVKGVAPDGTVDRLLRLHVQYHAGWIALSWTADVIMHAAQSSAVAHTDVMAAVFDDLRANAELIYSAASETYDLVMGDPDDDDE